MPKSKEEIKASVDEKANIVCFRAIQFGIRSSEFRDALDSWRIFQIRWLDFPDEEQPLPGDDDANDRT